VANFVAVPIDRLAVDTLVSLLEEFASRDGTDYGEREVALERKVADLRTQLASGDIRLLYDVDSEQWDLVDRLAASELLHD
jgi:uncharacterized protein YheU (UPF0270 family)